jgi:hypothetical protein
LLRRKNTRQLPSTCMPSLAESARPAWTSCLRLAPAAHKQSSPT